MPWRTRRAAGEARVNFRGKERQRVQACGKAADKGEGGRIKVQPVPQGVPADQLQFVRMG